MLTELLTSLINSLGRLENDVVVCSQMFNSNGENLKIDNGPLLLIMDYLLIRVIIPHWYALVLLIHGLF